jgi:hypothetical protein
VPQCYRRNMPNGMKSHRSHDIVLLCVFCHQAAHKSADRVKRALAAEYGVPLHPTLLLKEGGAPGTGAGAAAGGAAAAALEAARREVLARNARHAGIALYKGGDAIPEARCAAAVVWGAVVRVDCSKPRLLLGWREAQAARWPGTPFPHSTLTPYRPRPGGPPPRQAPHA